MIKFLIQRFIPHSEEIQNEEVRLSYGTLSSFVGMFCNILLFLCKICIGLLSHSLSIISDAFNNLTDLFNNIVTLFTYRLALKPADSEHPFGHGRLEYIVAFVAENIMIVVTFELLLTAIRRLCEPVTITMHPLFIVVLVLSILVKLWMYYFNNYLGKKAEHMAIQAVAIDSRNDAIMTSITLISLLLNHFVSNIPFDSILSIAISCVILYSIFQMAREAISKLIGNSVPSSYKDEIIEFLNQQKEVLGVHDFLVHDYGPTRRIGSLHVEMDASLSLLEAHHIIDQLEKELATRYHLQATIHIDPIEDNRELQIYKKKLTQALNAISPALSFHDFQIHNKTCSFDVVLPEHCDLSLEEIQQQLTKALSPLEVDITFDRGNISERVQL